MIFVCDGSELTVGMRNSGIVIRYRGKILGVMILIRNVELSWFYYGRVHKLSWNHIIRLPFKRKSIRF